MQRSSCLICNSKEIVTIIDLGLHPFADTFIPKERLGEGEMIYPLICDLCKNCGQIQTKCVTNPKERYVSNDYSYTSSNSEFSRNHWDEFALELLSKNQVKEDCFILEIGSNDGYLSEHFVKMGKKVLGVDPSPYMAGLAKKRNVETMTTLFDKKTSEVILKNYGKANLIIANNVFNHSDNPLDFAQAVKNVLAPNGIFIFEQPYWLIGFKEKKFDQIYHEHVSYFTVKSLKNLLEKAGMKIVEVRIVDYHGGSLRIMAQHIDYTKEESKKVSSMIAEEERIGTFNPTEYYKFIENLNKNKFLFLEKIYNIKNKGENIIAIGAAAKGNTFLNFYNLNNNIIDYVTDTSEHKKEKFTPGTRIPIRGDEILKKYDDVHALILSWNIADQLKEKLLEINPSIKFLIPD